MAFCLSAIPPVQTVRAWRGCRGADPLCTLFIHTTCSFNAQLLPYSSHKKVRTQSRSTHWNNTHTRRHTHAVNKSFYTGWSGLDTWCLQAVSLRFGEFCFCRRNDSPSGFLLNFSPGKKWQHFECFYFLTDCVWNKHRCMNTKKGRSVVNVARRLLVIRNYTPACDYMQCCKS